MQKLLITLIVLLFTYSAQGQGPFDELLKPKSIRQLERFVSRAGEVRSDTTAYWHYLRTLAPGKYREGVIRLTTLKRNKNDPNRATVNDYSIHLLAKGDHIFYYQVCEEQCEPPIDEEACYFKPIFGFRDPEQFNRMTVAFHSFFGTSLDTNELFLPDFPFGSLCGFGGAPTDGKLAIDSMLLLKDKAAIVSWLHSPNTEKQLYAAYALKYLKKQGNKLDKKERRLIRYIMRKKGTIYSCSYCIYDTESIRSIIKFLRKNPPKHEAIPAEPKG